ncbi:hypothetical protein [Candidatus Marithrix sp. Canyon 246]|uniref:hypothetical protein n=1 Tax=Candidatus Marithrix sp. Canyon 246 TaxID=1827136 RepID=UPI00084A1F9D|nr:hypothetical protein [Candidatus Marithrix sp. Canyon 246]
MQTLKVEIQDSLVEKILFLLNRFDGVKVETIDKREEFLEELKNSEDDILNGRVHKIDDVDKYIEELKNAID